MVAEGGKQALELMRTRAFDVVLLDIMMPGMNGYEVLQNIKTNPALRHIPVIMISALDEMDTVLRCIEMGAADYLTKPFEPALLRTRLQSSLSEKRMRDMEQAFLKQIQAEQEKSEWLLHNILPEEVAERLKKGESLIADDFTEATVLFSDIVGFTTFSARHAPADVVKRLNEIFLEFDKLVEKYSLEKIKTIGDAYYTVT